MMHFQAPSARAALHRIIWPLALVALLGAAWLSRAWLFPCAGRWLNVGQPPRRSDYVLVLPGGEETRPFVAAALVNAGLAKQALVPRVIASPDTDQGIERPAHEVICEVLTLRGVPRGRIVLLGRGSQSTYTDAVALRDFLADRPGATVAIVTHDFHTRRARWVFRRVLADRADRIRMVAAPHDKYNAETWWKSRESAAAYCGEFAKLAGYAVRYGDAWGWGGAVLLLAAAFFFYRRRRTRRRAERLIESVPQ